MKQIALDIGLSAGPTLANFCAGPNEAALRHMELWVGAKSGAGNDAPTRSPVLGTFGAAMNSMLHSSLFNSKLFLSHCLSAPTHGNYTRRTDSRTTRLNPGTSAAGC